jgi:3-oxoacyl-[acyl-carrier-protein] synthase-3
MHGVIAGIEYHLPSATVTTRDLAAEYPEWSIEKLDRRTGIETRYVAAPDECASDLALVAAEKLFASGICAPEDIDFILLCTQSPDYALPTTACLLQERLGIPTTSGALDFNLGCSGFVYGLGLAKGLISSRQARTILLITAETYSKYIAKDDRDTRAIFGDGAAATLIQSRDTDTASIGPLLYGTDGRGATHLIVQNSGCRKTSEILQGTGKVGCSTSPKLFMNGRKLFDFALSTIPQLVRNLLVDASLSICEIDLFVFHQANAYMLYELRRILDIPPDKLQITIRHCANTVSSTIPIALKEAHLEGKLKIGDRVMLVGFGVGYSSAATILLWAGI